MERHGGDILLRINCISFSTRVRDISIKISGPMNAVNRGSLSRGCQETLMPRGEHNRSRTTALQQHVFRVFVPQLSYIGFLLLDHPAYKLHAVYACFPTPPLRVPDFSFHGMEREREGLAR